MHVTLFSRKIQKYGINRDHRGTSLIEVAIAGLILIPLALCMLDLLVFVTTSSINEGAAKTAARAAANQTDRPSALAAAQKALNDYQPTTIATIKLIDVAWTTDKVVVLTQVQVRLPVPFPGITTETVMAQATEPVVSITE
jgi:Flp pilus assembly protein TadG